MSTLTEISLRNLKAPECGQVFYADDSLAGFGVRVSQGGTKTFTLRFGMPRQRVSLGRYPIISLSAARQRAKEILAENTLGKTRPTSVSFDDTVARFLADHAVRNRPRTIKDYTRVLKVRFPLGSKKLADIGREDIVRRLEKLDYCPTERRYATVIIKMLFRWAVRNQFLEHSPCEGIVPAKSLTRSRVLLDAELKAIWQACEGSFGDIVRLLILTGQRRGEIAALKAEYIGPDSITLPDHLCKNGREHNFPIARNAVSLLRRVVTLASPEKSPFLFPARGNPSAPFSGWSKSKLDLDARSGVTGWTLHDLRRTFATNLAALRVPPHIVERLLNHASGSISGVAAIYNRHTYEAECREAINSWEKKLFGIIEPTRRAA